MPYLVEDFPSFHCFVGWGGRVGRRVWLVELWDAVVWCCDVRGGGEIPRGVWGLGHLGLVLGPACDPSLCQCCVGLCVIRCGRWVLG